MIQTFDPHRLTAYERLLASPQPAHLPKGGSIHCWDGDPNRRITRLPAIMMAWLQRRHLDVDAEEPLPAHPRTFARPRSAARRLNPGLRVLRPTGS